MEKEYIIYNTYIFLFILYLLIIFANRSINFQKLFIQAIEDPKILRDISLGAFVNGMFSVLNSKGISELIGYLILTIITLIGIINANSKITKDR